MDSKSHTKIWMLQFWCNLINILTGCNTFCRRFYNLTMWFPVYCSLPLVRSSWLMNQIENMLQINVYRTKGNNRDIIICLNIMWNRKQNQTPDVSWLTRKWLWHVSIQLISYGLTCIHTLLPWDSYWSSCASYKGIWSCPLATTACEELQNSYLGTVSRRTHYCLPCAMGTLVGSGR